MHVCAPSYAFLPAICQALKIRKRLFGAKRGLREAENGKSLNGCHRK